MPTNGGATPWGMHVDGLKETMENLNALIIQYLDAGYKGLILATAYIRRQTESTAPLTPLDLGNLRASWLVVTSKGSIQGGEAKFEAKGFVGPRAGEILSDYQSAVNESRGLVRFNEQGTKIFVVFGYGAGYAVYVHENIGATFQKEGADAKWFETHIKRNTSQIFNIIKKEVQIVRPKQIKKPRKR
jgi:hypothetical protein